MKIDATKIAKTPFCAVSISWTVDGASGRTICEAWRVQHEIEQLERAGYVVISVEKA